MSGPALVWGIKQSLRNYVADGGEITLTDDAVESAAGYVFPSTDRHPDGALAFRGRVEFSAYGGLLCFVVADPVLDAERSTLTVLGRDGKRVAAAELTSHGTDFATVLAASGAGLFDGMYPAGTALDPILLTATAPMKRPVHGDDTHALPDHRPRPPIPTPS